MSEEYNALKEENNVLKEEAYKLSEIRLLEIELFSFCNRTCPWCPNSTIDRKHNQFLDWEILKKIVQELKDQKFKGVITFSRYNEPLSLISEFKERINYIHQELPNIKLVTNSNGDFVTEEVLKDLAIDELSIMDYDYLGPEECEKRLNSWGYSVQEVRGSYLYATHPTYHTQILYCTNWGDNRVITDRGGYLKEYSTKERQIPCYEPKYFCGINYDGTVSPCCNVRNDIEQHKGYVLGDLHNNTLTEVLNTHLATVFRANCSVGIYNPNGPCVYCDNRGGRYTAEQGSIFYSKEDRYGGVTVTNKESEGGTEV